MGTLGLRHTGPLPYTSHLNSQELFRKPAPLPRATIPLSLESFICSGSILAKPKVCVITFPTPGIRIECVPTFPFLHRISCMRESLLTSSCAACTAEWHARLGALPTFCNVSCAVYLWTEHTYQLWSLQNRWLVSYFSQTFHSVCFLFSIQFLISDLNLLKDSGRKGSGLIGLVLAPSLASLSAVSFY